MEMVVGVEVVVRDIKRALIAVDEELKYLENRAHLISKMRRERVKNDLGKLDEEIDRCYDLLNRIRQLRNPKAVLKAENIERKVKFLRAQINELLEKLEVNTQIPKKLLNFLWKTMFLAYVYPEIADILVNTPWESEFMKDLSDALKIASLRPLRSKTVIARNIEKGTVGVRITYWKAKSERKGICSSKKIMPRHIEKLKQKVPLEGWFDQGRVYIRIPNAPHITTPLMIFSRMVDTDLPPEVRQHAYAVLGDGKFEEIKIELNNFVVE